jgi:L-xylulokinase
MRDPRIFMVSAFGQASYSSMDNSATSASNLEWYVRTLIERGEHHPDPFGHVNAVVGAASIAPDDPMFHPFLYGSRHGAHHRGGFHGLTGWHDEGHLLRALFEGVCFEHRRHVEVLCSAGAAIDDVVLSGGGARSLVWSQMMADCLGRPIILGSEEESGALGAAIAAGIGIGLFADIEAGAAAMTRPRAQLNPDPGRQAVSDRRFAVWLRLTAAMESYWSELAGLRDA